MKITALLLMSFISFQSFASCGKVVKLSYGIANDGQHDDIHEIHVKIEGTAEPVVLKVDNIEFRMGEMAFSGNNQLCFEKGHKEYISLLLSVQK